MSMKVFGKFQDRLKLQHQVLLLLLLSSILPVSIVGFYGIYSSTTALSELSKSKLEQDTTSEAYNILNFLQGINEDVLFLSKSSQIQGIIRANDGGGVDPKTNTSYNAWIDQLQTTLVGMMEAKHSYMQLRYLDDQGNEIVRVDSDGTNVKIIPKTALQNKADRPYFSETMELAPGSLYTSPLDLNQERGQIERPFKPVIRYATPVVDSTGKKRGIVIANIFAKKFISYIFKEHS